VKNEIKLSQMVQSTPHVICRKEKNCYLLVNRKNSAVLVVNDVGMEIWNHMSMRITVGEIVEKLRKKYDVEFEDSKRETIKFIKELLENGFILSQRK